MTPLSPSRHSPRSLITLAVLAALLLAGFALRLWQLGADEFWFDEAASTFVANRPPLEIVQYVLESVGEHPPLYYLLLSGWMHLVGDGEFAQRYLSLLCGMLFVAMVGRLGFRLGGVRLGLLATVIAAIQPFAIYQAQENRMYSLVLFWSALAMWLLLDVLEDRRWASLALALVLVLGMATSYFFGTLVLAVALVLLWKQPPVVRRWWYLIVALIVAGMAGLFWLNTQPGPQLTLSRILMSPRTPELWLMNLDNALPRLSGDVGLGGNARIAATLVTWTLAAVGLFVAPRRLPLGPFFLAQLPLLLLLPWLDGRYWSALLPALVLSVAAALGWLLVRRWWLFVPAMVLLLLVNSAALQALYAVEKGYFGAALQSVADQFDNTSDVLVIPQRDSWVELSYYGQQLPRPLEVEYFSLDSEDAAAEDAEVETSLGPLLASRQRIVLGPVGASSRDPESRLERYLVQNAFAASRTFWPDSTFIALFVTPKPLEPGPTGLTYFGQVALQHSELSSLTIPAGEAIATRLVWEALQPEVPPLVVSLVLEDEQGTVWASQQTAPCNGWCPSTQWQPGSPVTDNRALIVPSDVPPGGYQLTLRLIDETSGSVEARALGAVTIQNDVVRAQVPDSALLSTRGIRLVDADVALPASVQLGSQLPYATRWALTDGAPEEWRVRWRLRHGDEVAQSWEEPPSRSDFPPALWGTDRVVRGVGTLVLGGTLPPQCYSLDVTVITPTGEALGEPLTLGDVVVEDRARTFELPGIGPPTDGRWQEGIHLAEADVPTTAAPGTALEAALVWQASGPTSQSYKVFMHVRDANNEVVAQDDTYPGAGGAPSNSWAEDEVVVDPHLITLPADLPPGSYTLVAGLYDPTTLTRVPLEDGGSDEYPLGTIEIAP